MPHLALHTLRSQLAALVAVAVATLGGAALLTAVGVLAESGWHSHAPVERLERADVVVAADPVHHVGSGGLEGLFPVGLPEQPALPADVVDRIAGLPGVADAVGDTAFPAALIGPDGDVVTSANRANRGDPADPATAGHGSASLRLSGDGASEDALGPGEVVLGTDLARTAGVAAGDRVTVVLAGERSERVVADVAPGSSIWVDDATAAALAPLHRVTVAAEPGRAEGVAEAVHDAVAGDGLVVATGADRGDLIAGVAGTQGRALLPVIAGSLAGITVLVVGLVVAGALGVAVQSRRRELALLRAVGATPRQVRRLTALQGDAVAVVAVIAGAPLGYVLAARLRDLLVATGLMPPIPLAIGPLPAVAAALGVLAVVHVSATLAAARVSRLPATEAVAESRTDPRAPSRTRATVGLALIALGTAASVGPLLDRSELGAAGTATAGLVVAIGLAVAGPAVVTWITARVARRLPSRVSAPTWLAVHNSRAAATRVGSAVATLALVVIFTLTYALTHTTLHRATADDVAAGTLADVVLTAPGLGGVPAGVVADAAALPGVRAAVPVRDTGVLLTREVLGDPDVEEAAALVLPPGTSDVLDLGVTAGSLDELTGDTVALDRSTARAYGAGVGDSLDLVLGDGTDATVQVVAVYDRGLGFGSVVLAADLAAGRTSANLADRVLVRTDGSPGTDAAVADLAEATPGVDAGSPNPGALIAPELWINVAVLVVVLGYLLLGVANTLVAATVRRRSELATLRLAGATPGQVLAVVRREAVLVTAVAVGVGTLGAVVPLALLGQALLGRPMAAGPAWLLPALAALVAAIAVVATELPARRALRDPATPGARDQVPARC